MLTEIKDEQSESFDEFSYLISTSLVLHRNSRRHHLLPVTSSDIFLFRCEQDLVANIPTYKAFKERKSNILITSDLAARGLDFEFLDGVINFDFPK